MMTPRELFLRTMKIMMMMMIMIIIIITIENSRIGY